MVSDSMVEVTLHGIRLRFVNISMESDSVVGMTLWSQTLWWE